MSPNTDKKQVVTRFAPSPTGFLHIGGARTALFNWLFARHHGGRFLLRIEDTDHARSTPEATQAILEGLSWMDLNPDLPPSYQSRGAEAHRAAAYALLDSGAAYKCYASDAEIDALRDAARDSGHALRSPYRDGKPAPNSDAPFAVRFRVPDGETTITDQVQGDITWQNNQFDDLVLLRADDTPTYMLAVVVDDHDMGITHVIRGDDHLINAGRQTQIYQALGWEVPVWAHLPLIHGPDGKKLSKRHGALGVGEYRDMGYLPAGLRNYLLRLGWASGDQELLTDAEAIQAFSLSGINSSPGRLDFDKMDFVNGHHLAETDTEYLMTELTPFLTDLLGRPATAEQSARIRHAMPILKTRAKTLKDLAEQAEFLCLSRPLSITGKAKKPLKGDAKSILQDLQNALDTVKEAQWSAAPLKAVLTTYAQDNGLGFGKIGMPLRAALTAGHPSPDLDLVLQFLGRDECLARIKDCIENFPAPAG